MLTKNLSSRKKKRKKTWWVFFQAPTALTRDIICCSGFGVKRLASAGSGILDAIRSGTNSGVADLLMDVDVCCCCFSGFGVNRPVTAAGTPGIRSAILSVTRSGVTARSCCSEGDFVREPMLSKTSSMSGEVERERTGYSVAGEARSRREVVGCGWRMVGVSTSSMRVIGIGGGEGPVRILEGRICSKPCSRATFSMDLKY